MNSTERPGGVAARIRGLPLLLGIGLWWLAMLIGVTVSRLWRGPPEPSWNRRQQATVSLMRRFFSSDPGDKLTKLRRWMDDLSSWTPLPRSVVIRRLRRQDPTAAPLVEVASVTQRPGAPIIYFLHGGGYMFCSTTTHSLLMARLAHAAQATVVAVDYRLAPEHPFPDALDDALAGYRHLLSRGDDPAEIVLAGDSAGGGLAVALLLTLRDRGEPLPAGAMLLSPWLDLAADDPSMAQNTHKDYLGDRAAIVRTATLYRGGQDEKNPLISPIYGDLSGLPPLLMLVGQAELMLDQIRRFGDLAREVGTEAEVQVWPAMVHVWPSLGTVFPQGEDAIRTLAGFARTVTSRQPAADLAPANSKLTV